MTPPVMWKRRSPWSPHVVVCPGCGRMRAVLRPDGTPTTCVSPLRAPVEGRAIPPARLSAGALTGTSPRYVGAK